MAFMSFWIALVFLACRAALPAPDGAAPDILPRQMAAAAVLTDEVPDWTDGHSLALVETSDARTPRETGHDGGLDVVDPAVLPSAPVIGAASPSQRAAPHPPERHPALGFDARAPPSLA